MKAANEILTKVADAFGVTPEGILSYSRRTQECDARIAFYYLARVGHGMEYPTLARWIGRNHAAVIKGVQRGKDLMETDKRFRRKVEELRSAFGF